MRTIQVTFLRFSVTFQSLHRNQHFTFLSLFPVSFFKNVSFFSFNAKLSLYISVDVRSSVIRFSTQRIIPEEVIQKAEIQVKVVCSEEQHPSTAHPIRLGLYDQMTAELISQALLRTAHPSWVVFPIQSIVVHWLRSLNTTRGVTVEVMENTEGQQNLSKILIYSGKNGSLDEPFMVVHTDGTLVHDVNAAIPLLKK